MPRPVFPIVLFLFWATSPLNSQSFQKEYTMIGSTSVLPYRVAQRPDSCFLVSHLVREDALRLHVTCISPAGDVLWSTRLYAHFNNDEASEGIKITPIMATSDNSCIVLVAKSLVSTGQGWALLKLSPDGTIAWKREIAGVGSVSDFLGYSQGRIYLVGRYWSFDNKPYMACLDDDGNVIWEKNIQSNLDNVVATDIRILPNQNILLSLAESSFLQQRGHIARLNSNGTLSNLLTLPNLSLMGVDEHPDGRLFFLARTLDSINLKNQVLLGAAQNGQLQWLKTIEIPQDYYLSGILTLNANKDSIVASFRASYFEGQRYWFRFDLNGNPGAAHYMPATESPGNEMITTLDGGFAWVSAAPATSMLNSFILSKTNAQALLDDCPAGILCGWSVRDTSFPVLPPVDWNIQAVSRIITGTAMQQPRTVTAIDFCQPLPMLDAAILTTDSTGCGSEAFIFNRLPAAGGISTWTFSAATPGVFSGPEPPGIFFPQPGIFQVLHVLDQAGCRDSASLNVQIVAYPLLSLPADTVLCPGSTLVVGVPDDTDLTFLWNDGETASSRSVNALGLYSLTVTNAAACTSMGTIEINPIVWPANLLPSDTFFCVNSAVTLRLGEQPGWAVQWADGFSDLERSFSAPGIFYLSAQSPEDCMLSDSIVITEKTLPDVHITTRLPYDCGAKRLEASGEALRFFMWSTGAASAETAIEQSGTYTVTVSDGFCAGTDTAQVEISPCPECFVYIPGVFKPGSGNGNDQFSLQSGCAISDFLLYVYDRWGNLLFESREAGNAWDGTYKGRQVSPGVYMYRLQMTLSLGDIRFPVTKTGDVSVVR